MSQKLRDELLKRVAKYDYANVSYNENGKGFTLLKEEWDEFENRYVEEVNIFVSLGGLYVVLCEENISDKRFLMLADFIRENKEFIIENFAELFKE